MRQLKIEKSFTNRESPSLDKYLQEIAKEPMITIEEETELARRIREGDQRAFEKLVRSNLRFVVSVAKQYQRQGIALPDLINEGNLGLIKAAQRFDETRGFKFISYAVWWIRQSILQSIAEKGRIVRLPLNQVGAIQRIHRATIRFEQEHDRNPSPEELADTMGIPVERILVSLPLASREVSLDTPLGENDEHSMVDVMVNNSSPDPEEEIKDESLQKDICRVLHSMSRREEEIIKRSFGIGSSPQTMEEIGRQLKLTRERVRQVREKALRKMRHSSRKNLLKKYLGEK
jgi:RNA polymerase primary sigma factor